MLLTLQVVPQTVQTDKLVMTLQSLTCQVYQMNNTFAIAQNPQPPGLAPQIYLEESSLLLILLILCSQMMLLEELNCTLTKNDC